MLDRFDYRKESWGYILQDKIHDRIWGISDQNWYDMLNGNASAYEDILSSHPYRHKGWFFIGDNKPEYFDISVPISISWSLTDQCNSRCLFCCNDADKSKNYGIETNHIFRILDEVKAWGIMRLIIGGGEPTVRHDISNILLYAHDIGLRPALATNGTMLTKEFVNLVKKVCCTLQISLDTLNRDTYCFLRGIDAIDDLKRNIYMAVEQAAPVRVVTVVTSKNYFQLDEIADFIFKAGIIQWFIFRMLQSGRAIDNAAQIGEINSLELMRKIHKLYVSYPDIDIFTWGDGEADQVSVYVESNGNIIVRDYRQGQLIKLNDIEKTSLAEAWSTFDFKVRSNSFINFIQPNRAVRDNYTE